MDDVDDLLDRKEAAALLRISARTLERLTGIPAIKVSDRRVVYRKGDLLDWIASRRAAGRAA